MSAAKGSTRIYSFGTPIDRAIEHVVLDEHDCWLWDGARTPGGYGHINCGGGVYRHAHIVTYEHFVGLVPEGLELDHQCNVRHCVNPWHLKAVTHYENVRRSRSPEMEAHRTGRCSRGHSLADAHRDKHGRVRNCRTCRNEKRRAGEWT